MKLSTFILSTLALGSFIGISVPIAMAYEQSVEYAVPPSSAINKVAHPDGRGIMRGPKVGNSKYDNKDGHDLREIVTTGDYRMPVILVQFADASFSQGKGDPRSLIDNMLNGENFDHQNATGSANAFYRATSRGMFNPQFDVYGPVTLSRNEREYVTSNPDDFYTDAEGKQVTVYPAGRMVEEAIKALDSEIDFSKYDSNGDGMVDFVYLFFAGKGATTGGSTTSTIWPHAFTLTSAIGAPVELDGVSVNRYATSSELGSDNRLSGIGTFCHEFAHVLGLPDLYDTSNNNGQISKCFTPGPFDCMDAGNYNNSEHTPPVFSSYEQYAMEWMNPVDIEGQAHLTMLPFEAWPLAYRVARYDTPTEYYLFENRGLGYYDSKLPGGGLLAWHIDYNSVAWEENRPNNDASHMRVDLIEADNEKSESTRAGDPFPGASGICEFTSAITPSFKDWSGNGMGYDLYGIRRNFDGTVEFDAVCIPEVVMPGGFEASPLPELIQADANSVTVAWDNVESYDDLPTTAYLVSAFKADNMTGGVVSYEAYAPGWFYRIIEPQSAREARQICVIDNLEPNCDYAVMVYAVNDKAAVRMEQPMVVRTVDASDFKNLRPNLNVYAEGSGVLAVWDEVPGTDTNLHIVTRSHGTTTSTERFDFSGNSLPEGWTGTGIYDTRSKYYGEQAPSYRFATSGSMLCSPMYEKEVKTMSFWCRKRYDDVQELCRLDVYTADMAGRWTFDRSLGGFTRDGGRMQLDFRPGVHGVRLVYHFWSTELDFNLDDVEILLSDNAVETEATESSISYEGPSAIVSGLKAGVDYYAYVTYQKDGVGDARSSEVSFNMDTLRPSGVDDIEMTSSANFRVEAGIIIPSDSSVKYSVFSLDGRCIVTDYTGNYTLPSKGIYVVRAASGNIVKVIY